MLYIWSFTSIKMEFDESIQTQKMFYAAIQMQ